MRDYDPALGRYLQADPLGLVDGASVYGYVRQNPGRYIDPTGEFGLVGALIGGGANFLSQFGKGLILYGISGYKTAFRCVDFSKVATSAAFGAVGASPFGMRKAGARIDPIAGVVGLKWWTENVTTPVVRIGDECECQKPESGNAFQDWLLEVMDTFYL